MAASAGAPAADRCARARSRPSLPVRPRILIVEDEPALLRALRINLRARSYEVITAGGGPPGAGRGGAASAGRGDPRPRACLTWTASQVIRELRTWSRAPVIVLSGRTGSGDKIGALDAGADDYVTKPFSMEELLARLRAALRREETAPDRQPGDASARCDR